MIRKKPKAFIGEIVDEEDFLAPQSQSSYDFGARGTRPFIAKTDADGRVAITIVGTTTVGTPVQKTARLILPPRPTFTPIKTTQACKSKGSSPFQYCAECKFSLAAAQIGANIVASLTSGPTLTLSCPGFKPNSTLFIQASGGVNCASGIVAARLALLGPDGAEIAREHSKASRRALLMVSIRQPSKI